MSHSTISRRAFLAALSAAPFASAWASPITRNPSFKVLSLFRPQRLVLRASTDPLHLTLENETVNLAPGEMLAIEIGGTQISVADSAIHDLHINTASAFSLEVPGKLRREYLGSLAIDSFNNQLRAVIAMESELAVASIVAAESPSHATANFLAAQAVASRSFMLGARTSHAGADFCDTTHCQYLREPPLGGSAFVAAAQRTSGLVLSYRDPRGDSPRTLAARYSRSCGGRTRTLAELGLPANGYPYYAVECAFCRAHPEKWQRDITLTANNERARLDYNRIHGWSALPGHIDRATALRIEGRGIGHGLGLCQLGAADMAARGASFGAILAHYYPNTTLAPAS